VLDSFGEILLLPLSLPKVPKEDGDFFEKFFHGFCSPAPQFKIKSEIKNSIFCKF
jgi:hypothetical protein